MHYLIDGYNFLFSRAYGSSHKTSNTPSRGANASPGSLTLLGSLQKQPEDRFQARALGRSQPDPKAHSLSRYPPSPKPKASDALQVARKDLIDELSGLVEPYIEKKNRLLKSCSPSNAPSLRVRLIFDSPSNPGDAGYDRYCPIEVIYTPRNLSADEFILEIIQAQTIRSDLIVVTQDQRLGRQVEALGCHVQDFDTFLERLQKGTRRLTASTAHSRAMRERWVQHYCDLFENRYRLSEENEW